MFSGKGRKTIGIVIPVFNDWKSLERLIRKLDEQAEVSEFDFHLFVVDDASSESASLDYLSTSGFCFSELQLIRLSSNLGHQRAIAVGLVVASRIKNIKAVVVMDADGEDRPEDVSRLAAAWSEDVNRIVVAQRGERSEGFAFRFFYAVYKFAFRILTGQKIDFGNFCLLPQKLLRALTYNPAIWNNLAAAITRSQIPRTSVLVARGARLADRSRMNFESLVFHGVSAMAVYADVVLLRILFGACMLAGLAALSMAGVIAIRFGTDKAIPGWATYSTVSLTIIFIQALLISAMALFQLVSFRNVRTFIPALDAPSFIRDSKITTRGQTKLPKRSM
jgi:glycosyltransferase involved in cell wall biosynthesis